MQTLPRGLKTLAAVAVTVGLALSVAQRWLIWRALVDASPNRRHAALYSWHLGMLRTDYYPETGQHLLPAIRTLSGAGALFLLCIAAILLRWTRRAGSSTR